MQITLTKDATTKNGKGRFRASKDGLDLTVYTAADSPLTAVDTLEVSVVSPPEKTE